MPSPCFGLNREEFTFIREGEGRGARPAPQAETPQSPGVTAHRGRGRVGETDHGFVSGCDMTWRGGLRRRSGDLSVLT